MKRTDTRSMCACVYFIRIQTHNVFFTNSVPVLRCSFFCLHQTLTLIWLHRRGGGAFSPIPLLLSFMTQTLSLTLTLLLCDNTCTYLYMWCDVIWFDQVADVVLCKSISADGSTKKRLVIMDEVDGMGGSDRGGIPELIKVSMYVCTLSYLYVKSSSFHSPLSLSPSLSYTHTHTHTDTSSLSLLPHPPTHTNTHTHTHALSRSCLLTLQPHAHYLLLFHTHFLSPYTVKNTL